MSALPLPLILIGPMGVGKTTVGKKLARSLGVPFVDTDSLVVAKHGPIEEIFHSDGEDHFRELETEALKIALETPAVVATGGGIVIDENNRRLMAGHTVIYLSTDGKHLVSRLKNGKRPLLKNGMDDWKRIYDARRPLYEGAATHTVDTSSTSLRDIVQNIEELIR